MQVKKDGLQFVTTKEKIKRESHKYCGKKKEKT